MFDTWHSTVIECWNVIKIRLTTFVSILLWTILPDYDILTHNWAVKRIVIKLYSSKMFALVQLWNESHILLVALSLRMRADDTRTHAVRRLLSNVPMRDGTHARTSCIFIFVSIAVTSLVWHNWKWIMNNKDMKTQFFVSSMPIKLK